MLPVKLKLVSIKNILSRWLHIDCLASHIIFTCWPTQRVGLSHFCFFFTGQLNVLACLIFAFFYWRTQRVGLSHFCFFLLANSTCWPISFFLLANSMCWPISFFYWPTQYIGSHRLLLVAFPHARKIFLEVLAIDGYRKLDTI